ncbi:TagK domain-containing protein [Burkholderia sp. Bp9090]|uniref:TagK domain-containing protein n=1 Tax=Burkholderia sp. Bp9090 TaxID=2184567 RepID=UPI000F5EF339|nr:TagK domain-containing protein [Burkholderia sp. Bp9090]RQZ24528.1 TagK domain-containing protein [Burkholderia sp. Bp9090]
MRSPRPPWHSQSNIPLVASAPENARPRPVTDTLQLGDAFNSARAGDDMLGLLDIGTREGAARPHDAAGTADIEAGHTDALIDALHAQYWRALAEPGAPIASAWAPSVDDTLTPPIAPNRPHDSPACESPGRSDSIETFLSGNRTIEDAFGHLDGHAEAVADGESVPEILQLFAPPEFHAESVRRAPAPPPLTRREHHALSVDSPLAAPLRKDQP